MGITGAFASKTIPQSLIHPLNTCHTSHTSLPSRKKQHMLRTNPLCTKRKNDPVAIMFRQVRKMLCYATKTPVTRRYAVSSISIGGAGSRHTEAIAGAWRQCVGVNDVAPPLGVLVDLRLMGLDC